MALTNRSIVAGVFQDDARAQQAMTDLQNAGFTDDQIRYSVHKGGSGILASLVSMGFPQDEASFYNDEFMAGRTIVTVKTNDRIQEAYDILMRNGAYDASTRAGQSTGYAQSSYTNTAATQTAGYATTANTGYTDTTAQTNQYGQTGYDTPDNQKIRLREEQLQANKERVQAGEVGIHKEVVTEEKTLNVPVSREEVYIERNPVSGNVPADAPIDEQGEEIRVPVTEERVNVTKQPVVTEEINVGKRVVQDNQQVSDTVRREEARIDRSGNVNVNGTSLDDPTLRDDQYRNNQ